jgi:hypothetical protein
MAQKLSPEAQRMATMTAEELAEAYPEAWAWLDTYFDTLPEAALDAIAREDPGAQRELLRAWHEWLGEA